ncbi:MAG: TIGR03960 family B12-binding radical SAM protein [Planctomycetota bacterium]
MPSVLDQIRPFLTRVKNPAQYVGGEWNRVLKDPEKVLLRAAVAFPDLYAVGMSHLGIKVVHGVLNTLDEVWCEHAFAPWPDMGSELQTRGIPLFTVESHTPLNELDLLGFSLQSELTYTNVLYMLDLGQVPLLARERGEADPIVIAGGSGASHPEPMADFIDIFLQGDGEEAVVSLAGTLLDARRAGLDREAQLLRVARQHDFCYVPRFFDPEMTSCGRYLGLRPTLQGLPSPIRAACVSDFENAFYPTAPMVPTARVVQDRIILEIMRGCARSCRFCQAGMMKRPIRYRTPEKLVGQALEAIHSTGYGEVSLQSLSSGDYPEVEALLELCDAAFARDRVSLAMPSLRVTQQLALLPGRMKSVRKSALTMAPEVATDRLRKIINKEILNADLYAAAAAAFENGWDQVKLYFMIGVPGETREDLAAIWEMASRVSRLRKQVTGKADAKVSVSVSTFIPKAFTPFQWARMLAIDEIRERQQILRDLSRNRRVRFSFHMAEASTLEGVIGRGDRRAGAAILSAYRKGARFDAWDECFRWETWQEAFEESGVDPRELVNRTLDPDDALPWDHIETGVARSWLRQEWERALAGVATPDCLGQRCNRCGLDVKVCAELKAGFRKAVTE